MLGPGVTGLGGTLTDRADTGAHFRSITIGIMARAKELYPVELYAFGGLRNHLICSSAPPKSIASPGS